MSLKFSKLVPADMFTTTKKENNKTKSQERLSAFEYELESLWFNVISAFGYELYYKNDPLFEMMRMKSRKKGLNNENGSLCKQMHELMSKNGLGMTQDYNLTINNHKGRNSTSLMRSEKIWIIMIIINYGVCHSLEIAMGQFESALENVTNIPFLFEFFLIFISRVDKQKFTEEIVKNDTIFIPDEFMSLYKGNKKMLKKLFECNDNDNKRIDTTSISASVALPIAYNDNSFFHQLNEGDYSFSQSFKGDNKTIIQIIDLEEKLNSPNEIYENENDELLCNIDIVPLETTNSNSDDQLKKVSSSHTLDEYLSPQQNDETPNTDSPYKDIEQFNDENNEDKTQVLKENEMRLILKDYCNKGLFAVFEKQIGHVIIPLKKSFDTTLEKFDVQLLIKALYKSIYSNFDYIPYDEDIIKQIVNEEAQNKIIIYENMYNY